MLSTKQVLFPFLIWVLTSPLVAQDALSSGNKNDKSTFQMKPGVSRQEVVKRTLAPFAGPTNPGVDATTLSGKVMCGYQGWFTCPGDGSGRGWHHWQKRGRFEPGSCTIDLWPDVREFSAAERFITSFQLNDGSPAAVYSPMVEASVRRHFKWMREYGIDGVFVQRFGAEIRSPMGLYHFNTVLANCRSGANAEGRVWALMYDLSGLQRGQTQTIIDDWKMLVDRMRLGRDKNDSSYLRHRGKPVVAVWGIGFNDNRKYTLEECDRLIQFFSEDPEYGGATVMVGVPTYWRTLRRDCLADEKVHAIIRRADIVSPWMVGRFGTPQQAEHVATTVWKPDLAWCHDNGKDYLPVVFPGFSQHNMSTRSPLAQIPRLGGRFLWKQYHELHGLGATMVYQAMFDEVDEGTAIFKCTNNPPVGKSRFLRFDGLPSDHYLWLVGQGGRLIRGEMEASEALPPRR